jgi:hypothetical protein
MYIVWCMGSLGIHSIFCVDCMIYEMLENKFWELVWFIGCVMLCMLCHGIS